MYNINIYINSPGGEVTSGLAIYDVIQHVRAPIATYCVGLGASMGALLLTAGSPGKRFALPHSRIMIHQPLGAYQGQATDIEIQAREILKLKREINEILVKHTKQPLKKIEADTERDFYMSGEEAKAYGIVDDVVIRVPKK